MIHLLILLLTNNIFLSGFVYLFYLSLIHLLNTKVIFSVFVELKLHAHHITHACLIMPEILINYTKMHLCSDRRVKKNYFNSV